MPRLPDFLYIGGAKCGSSWIYEILRSHPGIFIPEAKDIQFFDRYYGRGLGWYGRFFDDATDEQLAGELSHDYFFSGDYAARISKDLPNVKIFACLREPVDRIISHYHYGLTVFLTPETSLIDFSKSNKGLKGSRYYENLKPFYDLFPRENIRIFFFDDLKRDPVSFCRELYEFLGVDRDHVSPHLHLPSRPARTNRFPKLGHVAYSSAQLLRTVGAQNLVGFAKRNSYFNRLLFRPTSSRPDVDPGDKQAIQRMFRGDYDDLEALIGRPLPDAWRKAY